MKKRAFVGIAVCLFLVVAWWLLSAREYTHKDLMSQPPREECYLCSGQIKEGELGILDLNTWDLLSVKLKPHEDGQQTADYQIETGMRASDGTAVEVTAYPNRGYAYGKISGSQYRLNRAFIQERLCQTCLNRINETVFYDQAPAEYALVNFSENTIYILAKGTSWIYTGDYKIGCAYEADGTINLLIHDRSFG